MVYAIIPYTSFGLENESVDDFYPSTVFNSWEKALSHAHEVSADLNKTWESFIRSYKRDFPNSSEEAAVTAAKRTCAHYVSVWNELTFEKCETEGKVLIYIDEFEEWRTNKDVKATLYFMGYFYLLFQVYLHSQQFNPWYLLFGAVVVARFLYVYWDENKYRSDHYGVWIVKMRDY